VEEVFSAVKKRAVYVGSAEFFGSLHSIWHGNDDAIVLKFDSDPYHCLLYSGAMLMSKRLDTEFLLLCASCMQHPVSVSLLQSYNIEVLDNLYNHMMALLFFSALLCLFFIPLS